MHQERTISSAASSGEATNNAIELFKNQGTHKRIDTVTPAVAAVNRRCLVYSPVTELANDFKDLSGLSETPMRRQSLSSAGTPASGRQFEQSPKAVGPSCLSGSFVDAGSSSDSSASFDGDAATTGRKIHVSNLKRIVSLPVFDIDDELALPPPSPIKSKGARQRNATRAAGAPVAFPSLDFSASMATSKAPPFSVLAADSYAHTQNSEKHGSTDVEQQLSIPCRSTKEEPQPRKVKARSLGWSIFRPPTSSDSSLSCLSAHCEDVDDIMDGHASGQHVTQDVPLLQSSWCSVGDKDSDTDDGYHDSCDFLCQSYCERGMSRIPNGIANLLTAPMVTNKESLSETPSRKRSLFRSPSVPDLPRLLCNRYGCTARRSQCTVKRPDPPDWHSDDDPTPVANKRRCRPADTESPSDSRDSIAGADTEAEGAHEELRDVVASLAKDDAPSQVKDEAGSLAKDDATPLAKDDAAEPPVTLKRQSTNCNLQRCKSMVEQSIHFYMTRTDDTVDMTGDLVTPCCLPLVKSKHGDLRCIAPLTMASVLQDQYSHVITNYYIIDCRYPYEFESGHIKGALNLYSKDDIFEEFLKQPPALQQQPNEHDDGAIGGRTVLIFHCEFSSERGPRLSRFLRNHDRQSNKEHYPWLFYPEVYLLEGGYKAFYEQYPELCEPRAYKPMLHPDHTAELRQFRQKSKSWCGGGGGSGSSGGGAGGRPRLPLRSSLTLAW